MRIVVRFVVVLVLAGLGLAAGVAFLTPAAGAFLSANHTSHDRIAELEPLAQRSIVYARDGSILASLHAEQDRQPVRLARVPKHVVQAILDVEDYRFFHHGAVDVRSTLRALYANVHSGGIEQGGSTITQQLVKNTLLTSKRDAGRKLKEAILAIRLANHMSKRAILERYLNTVYFGNGAYGVQAAAERYFGKDVGTLTPGDAALLAGLIRNPAGYDPFVHANLARDRRDFALRRMVRLGDLTSDAARRYTLEALPSQPFHLLPTPQNYFVEEVKQQLLQDRRLGDTPTARYNAVFKGGLSIHTTLDPTYQRIAEEKVSTLLPDTHGRFTAALVSVDAHTGAVRALVGGPGFEQAKYDLATQGHRQAGSSFKMFTLVTALLDGHSPKDTISGQSPCRIPNPGGTPNPWRPTNFEGEAAGVISLTDATVKSVNCAYARLAVIIGVNQIADIAEQMGITTHLDRVPAMTLGASQSGVSPLQMASAYATLADDGVHHKPYFIESVVGPDHKTIIRARPEGDRVIPSQIARMATSVLQQVVQRGTGTKARQRDREVAGKTGTAENYQDAWFVGYTPQLSTAVWMGSPVGEVPMRSVGGIRVVGGSYPATIWGAYTKEAMAGEPAIDFPLPNSRLFPRARYLHVAGEKIPGTTSSTKPKSTKSTTTPSATSPSSIPTTVPTSPPDTTPPGPPGKKEVPATVPAPGTG